VRAENRRERPKRRRARLVAEFVGTIVVTLATVLPEALDRGLGLHVPYAVRASCTGIATMIVIYALGEVSGAHTNPIVTIAFALRGDFDWSRVPEYVGAQFAGAIAAGALALAILRPEPSSLRGTLALGPGPAFWLEIVLTAILVLVAISTANKARFLGPQTAFANGATTIFDRLIGYHVSTGSMNPARTLGPLLLVGGTPNWWVFVFGPLLGAGLAVWLTWLIHGGPNEQEAAKSHG
jgi:aquaporin Z